MCYINILSKLLDFSRRSAVQFGLKKNVKNTGIYRYSDGRYIGIRYLRYRSTLQWLICIGSSRETFIPPTPLDVFKYILLFSEEDFFPPDSQNFLCRRCLDLFWKTSIPGVNWKLTPIWIL
jgi:hypothetical protein